MRQGSRIAFEHGLDDLRRKRKPGGNRQSRAQRFCQRCGLAAELRFVDGVDEPRRLHRPALTSSTMPWSPLTRTRAPSVNVVVAARVPTTAGMPYSRATIAACES